MQLCKLCETSSESPSDHGRHAVPRFKSIQAADVRIVAIKCGHIFHYTCLFKQDALETRLINCVVCMRRTRFSDIIMLNPSNLTSSLFCNPNFPSNDISSQPRLPIRRQNRFNYRLLEIILPRDLKVSHVIKAILLGVLTALLVIYLSGGINRKSKGIDFGRIFKPFVDFSLYTLKGSTKVICYLLLKLYKGNSVDELYQLWENLKLQATNCFQSCKIKMRLQAKKVWESSGRALRWSKRTTRRYFQPIDQGMDRKYLSSFSMFWSNFSRRFSSIFPYFGIFAKGVYNDFISQSFVFWTILKSLVGEKFGEISGSVELSLKESFNLAKRSLLSYKSLWCDMAYFNSKEIICSLKRHIFNIDVWGGYRFILRYAGIEPLWKSGVTNLIYGAFAWLWVSPATRPSNLLKLFLQKGSINGSKPVQPSVPNVGAGVS